MPEFTRRCVEEFGADYVRLRPFEPWREVGMMEWFMDVRNVYHPEHEEFLEVMKHPIFKHPKVHDWGGGLESGLGPEPYINLRMKYKYIEKIMQDGFADKVSKVLHSDSIVIYGVGIVGQALVRSISGKIEIPYCIDRANDGKSYDGIKIYGTGHMDKLDKDIPVIVSLVANYNSVIKLLNNEGYNRDIVSIEHLLEEI